MQMRVFRMLSGRLLEEETASRSAYEKKKIRKKGETRRVHIIYIKHNKVVYRRVRLDRKEGAEDYSVR